MKIAIAADHGGFSLKADIVELLTQAGHESIDLGAHEHIAGDDYPDYALLVGQAVPRDHVLRDRDVVELSVE